MPRVSTLPIPLPDLLPPAVAPAGVTDAVVDLALATVHPLLDELAAGPLTRAGRAEHEVKGDGTPVTTVDVEVDERITEAVTAAFPGHDVVSEELDATATDAEWQWVVDPVDGTSNFAAGLPHWGVSIALCHGGVPIMGVVDAPRLGHRWAAVRGRGCQRDGEPVRVRSGVSLDDPHTAHLPFLTSLGLLGRVRRGSGVRLHPRVLGAAAVDGAFVADGTAVASIVAKGKVWDVAAASVLTTEAGGAALALDHAVFPLVAGRDHEGLRTPTAFGPGRALLEELVTRLWPETGSLLAQ